MTPYLSYANFNIRISPRFTIQIEHVVYKNVGVEVQYAVLIVIMSV